MERDVRISVEVKLTPHSIRIAGTRARQWPRGIPGRYATLSWHCTRAQLVSPGSWRCLSPAHDAFCAPNEFDQRHQRGREEFGRQGRGQIKALAEWKEGRQGWTAAAPAAPEAGQAGVAALDAQCCQ